MSIILNIAKGNEVISKMLIGKGNSKPKTQTHNSKLITGCGAVRLAHLLWEQGAAGSNPATPTLIELWVLELEFPNSQL